MEASEHTNLPQSLLPDVGQARGRDFITRFLSPRIAVVASPDLESLCIEKGFKSFTELLQPFGARIDGRVTCRDAQGLPVPMDNMVIRFDHLNSLGDYHHDAIMRVVANNIQQQVQEQPIEAIPIRGKEDITEAYLQTDLDELTPHYTTLKDFVFTLSGITEHSAFDHPVACVIGISNRNEAPIDTLLQLYNSNTPATVFEKGFVDTNLLRYYILIHDDKYGSKEESEALLEKMRRTFGLHCCLVTLNAPASGSESNEINLQEWQEIFKKHAYKTEALAIQVERHTRALYGSSDDVAQNLPPPPQTSSLNSTPILTYRSEAESVGITPSSGAATPTTSSVSTPTGRMLEPHLQTPTSEDPLFHTETNQIPDIELGEAEVTDADTAQIKQRQEQQVAEQLLQESSSQIFSEADIASLKSLVRQMVTQSLIPFMERSIQQWNEQVAAARRGLTGRFLGASRRLFGNANVRGSPGPQSLQAIPAFGPNVSPATPTTNIYPSTTPEAQMRKLADYAFMLRDYKFAFSIYEAAKRDYAADKAWMYLAGVQEMMGLCLLMMAQPLSSKADVDHQLESAVSTYINRCQRPFHAMKSTIMYYELFQERQMWKDAPSALVRLTGEDSSLRSGIFLEQASHCFLRTNRPMVRKFGFHMVMAGHRYTKCGQREHAHRCYESALQHYSGKNWSLIDDHINFALGRQSYHLGELDAAMKYFLKLLHENPQAVSQQVIYWREFVLIYEQYAAFLGKNTKTEVVAPLPIPIINADSLSITTSNVGASSVSGLAMHSNKGSTRCAVKEPLFVQFALHNPLQFTIYLSDIRILVKDKGNISIEAAEQTLYGADEADEYPSEAIGNLELGPKETKRVSVKLYLQREGRFRIVGLTYQLNDLMKGYKPIDKRGKRLQETLQQRLSPTYAADTSLDIVVSGPMPLLDVYVHDFPEVLYSGEVVRTTLELRNNGAKAVRFMTLRLSHPSFFHLEDERGMNATVYDGVTDASPVFESSVTIDNAISDKSTIEIPIQSANEQASLDPGETMRIPLWIRGDKIGKHHFELFFEYQSEKGKRSASRSLQHFLDTQVLPSIKINAFTRPSLKKLNHFILGIEIENLQPSNVIQIPQITATSMVWHMRPVNEPSILEIPPRQTAFSFYRLGLRTDAANATCEPEQWISDALEMLILKENVTSKPPRAQLYHSNIAFSPGKAIDPSGLKYLAFTEKARTDWRLTALAEQYPILSRSQLIDHFTLYNTFNLDLTVFWDISHRSRRGHHYVQGMNLAAQQSAFQGQVKQSIVRSLFETTELEKKALIKSIVRADETKDDNPVRIILQSPDVYAHDFEAESLCNVPVTFTLQNSSWNKTVQYALEFQDSKVKPVPIQTSGPDEHSPNFLPLFHWNDIISHQGTLDPYQKVDISAKVCFSEPGVFDINQWRLTISPGVNNIIRPLMPCHIRIVSQ